MKINQLVDKMKHYDIKLPDKGTGLNGRILARDLENALGDHFAPIKYTHDPMKLKHLKMRQSFVPMKAYRYDKLNPYQQLEVMDSKDWIAEEKYNGWRMIITYIPEDGFCFWGGNISDVDFLPVDYTEHVLLHGYYPRDHKFKMRAFKPFAFDAEAICYDQVETQDGLMSNNTLDAVGAILGSLPEKAKQMQRDGAKIIFPCFDCVMFDGIKPTGLDKKLLERKVCLTGNLALFHSFDQLQYVSQAVDNKQQHLNYIWKKGGEGVILKNINQRYVSGSRLKSHNIKIKRTMSGDIGDDIDAFISGCIITEEWLKKNLIGGIKLSVFVEEGGEKREHHIATVSGMPDSTREMLSESPFGFPILKSYYYNKVLVVDGQELSNRNMKIMHAKVNWERGFRTDKSYQDCVLDLDILKEERF